MNLNIVRNIENPHHGERTCEQTEGSSSSVDTDLPEDLLERIFSWIPFPQVYKVRALSKHWCSKYTPPRDSDSLHLYPFGTITASQNWPSYVSVFRIRHKLISPYGPHAYSAQTATLQQPFNRLVYAYPAQITPRPERLSHIDLFALNERANSWKPFAFHPRLAQVFETQSFEHGILSPGEYWRKSTWAVGGSLVAVFIPSSSPWSIPSRLLVTNWLTGDTETVPAPGFSTLPRPETRSIPVGSKDYEVFQLDSQWQRSTNRGISTLVCHHYDSCRKTWLSKSVVESSDVPGQKLEIAGDGSMPFLFPNWVRIGDTICALISQDEKMFIASWNLKTGTLETKLLPLEYEDELQLFKAGVFLVASKFVIVILFAVRGVPTLYALSASEVRFYDYEPEGCYFAEVYRTQGQGFTRYGKDLVADSECIHLVAVSYNIREVQRRNIRQPGLNPFAVP
ncbi:hypothetical protein R1sor_017247 [Riccia sorocarpa]|uniref:F-box domain-containing protein n=1 Tax=Riccia sorocarpa TaxID=122646 RepID=A0ABD3I691_9MARC